MCREPNLPTRFRGTPEETRALDAFIKLERAGESVFARLGRHLTGHGLTHGQLGVLDALHHCGPMCQKDLGGKVLRSSSNVTVVVDNLERRGLVRRVRDVSDRRMVEVSLTAEGRKLLKRVFPTHVREIVEIFSGLSAKEVDRLGEICRKLGRSIRPEAGSPPLRKRAAGRSPRSAGD